MDDKDGGGDENGIQCSREEEYDVDVEFVELTVSLANKLKI